MTAIATAWLDDGTVSALEAEKRKDARARQWLANCWPDWTALAIHRPTSSGCPYRKTPEPTKLPRHSCASRSRSQRLSPLPLQPTYHTQSGWHWGRWIWSHCAWPWRRLSGWLGCIRSGKLCKQLSFLVHACTVWPDWKGFR